MLEMNERGGMNKKMTKGRRGKEQPGAGGIESPGGTAHRGIEDVSGRGDNERNRSSVGRNLKGHTQWPFMLQIQPSPQ